MGIVSTENRIESLEMVNRLTAKALQELNARQYFYNQHADLFAKLRVFAATHGAQVGLRPIIENKHPVVFLLVDMEEVKKIRRALKRFFRKITGRLDADGDEIEFFGLLYTDELSPKQQLRLTIVIKGQ